MPEPTSSLLTPKDRLMQIARGEMEKFEIREAEFRKQLKAERARELSLPVHFVSIY